MICISRDLDLIPVFFPGCCSGAKAAIAALYFGRNELL